MKDREEVKKLVALIEAKRSFGKELPGQKAVSRVLRHPEFEKRFLEGDKF